jgi:hypothetical protein
MYEGGGAEQRWSTRRKKGEKWVKAACWSWPVFDSAYSFTKSQCHYNFNKVLKYSFYGDSSKYIANPNIHYMIMIGGYGDLKLSKICCDIQFVGF